MNQESELSLFVYGMNSQSSNKGIQKDISGKNAIILELAFLGVVPKPKTFLEATFDCLDELCTTGNFMQQAKIP